MSKKRVVSIEKGLKSVYAEGFGSETFYFIRLSDEVRDTWIVLSEDDFEAIREHFKNGLD